jgi:hypothetical protein
MNAWRMIVVSTALVPVIAVRPETAGGAVLWRSRPMLSAGCLQGWLIVAG